MKLNLVFAAGCLLALSACGIVTPLPQTTYAELRLGDDGKRQLLIESDQWRGMLAPDGPRGNQHYTQSWFPLQGDGPVYAINEDAPEGYKRVGTITIDIKRKQATIDLWFVPGDGGKATPFLDNGSFPITLITHEPFFSLDRGENYNPK